jgi:hypothetical protein
MNATSRVILPLHQRSVDKDKGAALGIENPPPKRLGHFWGSRPSIRTAWCRGYRWAGILATGWGLVGSASAQPDWFLWLAAGGMAFLLAEVACISRALEWSNEHRRLEDEEAEAERGLYSSPVDLGAG